MSENIQRRFLPDSLLSQWIIDRFGIWQMSFLDANQFASFVKARGLPYSFGNDIEQLWRIGVLKADLVESKCELGIPGLDLLRIDDDVYQYADNRDSSFSDGLRDSIGAHPELPCEVKLYFHPFRYFVLFHLNQNFRPNIHTKQYFLHADRYHRLIEFWLEEFDKRSNNPRFGSMLQYWETITELIIATEPYLYPKLFGRLRVDVVSMEGEMDTWQEEQQKRIDSHWQDVKGYYATANLDRLEKARRELCLSAEMLDPNKTVHNILRLVVGEHRIKNIRGTLGGAMLLLTMAEILRRATEEIYDVALPEEDELGFGVVFADVKEELYGSKRIFDGDTEVVDNFLRLQGLNYGVCVRWYVEGDTEYYFLENFLDSFPMIELKNLRGRIVERGDRGLSFRDSLRDDIRSRIFSWVLLDADNDDYVRAVRKAADDDDICGAFYISEPDFEFGNFSLEELEYILWEIAQENNAKPEDHAVLHNALRNVQSGKELEKEARNAISALAHFRKGEDWGIRLMKYASSQPEFVISQSDRAQLRPISDALQWAIHATTANYRLSRENQRVDPVTGRAIDRQ